MDRKLWQFNTFVSSAMANIRRQLAEQGNNNLEIVENPSDDPYPIDVWDRAICNIDKDLALEAEKKYSQKNAQPATRLRKAANGDVTDLYTRDGKLWGKVQVYSKVDNHEYEEKITELEKTIADLTSLIESEEYQAFKTFTKVFAKK